MITVKVPATSANLGPGFDTLGLALSLFLEVEMNWAGENRIECTGEDAEKLAYEIDKNLVFKAAKHLLAKTAAYHRCLDIRISNSIPTGKGMGSSAAAIVAGMFGVNELLKRPYSRTQLLKWAVEMEGHADNIVPAVAGGLTTALISGEEVLWHKIHPPDELKLVLVVPEFDLPTHQSRLVLPEKITLEEAVQTIQKACFLMMSVSKGDLDNLQAAMNDEVIQARRRTFIPVLDKVINSAMRAGAKGVALSGAGPSIIALTVDNGDEIGAAMKESFEQSGAQSRLFVLKPCTEGMTIVVS